MMIDKDTMWILILAAGESRRFSGPKPLAPWGEATLLSHIVSVARILSGSKVMIVLGAYVDALSPQLQDCPSVFNADWMQGKGSSVAIGVRRILMNNPQTKMVVLLTVDQPLITTVHLEKLIALAAANDSCAFTSNGQICGPPVAVPRHYFQLLLKLTDEKGLKAQLSNADITTVYAPEIMLDIDTPFDLQRLEEQSGKRTELHKRIDGEIG
jgi:molybdenum cofactor cytidylyltransferase